MSGAITYLILAHFYISSNAVFPFIVVFAYKPEKLSKQNWDNGTHLSKLNRTSGLKNHRPFSTPLLVSFSGEKRCTMIGCNGPNDLPCSVIHSYVLSEP